MLATAIASAWAGRPTPMSGLKFASRTLKHPNFASEKAGDHEICLQACLAGVRSNARRPEVAAVGLFLMIE
jgi:hypothetical protein